MTNRTRAIAFLWGILALVSVLVFAFTGIPLWAPVRGDGEGLIRTMVLLVFHMGGFVALACALDR